MVVWIFDMMASSRREREREKGWKIRKTGGQRADEEVEVGYLIYNEFIVFLHRFLLVVFTRAIHTLHTTTHHHV